MSGQPAAVQTPPVEPRAPQADPPGATRVVVVPHGFETNYTVGYVRGLAANGVTPLVVSADTDCEELTRAGVPNVNLRGQQGPDRPASAKAITVLRYYIGLIRLLVRERGCTVHFTGLFKNRLILFEGIALNLAFRRLSGRYIYTVHNVLPHGKEHSRFFAWVYAFVYRVPDRLIVHAPGARRQLVQRFGIPEDKIQLASIGLNEEAPLTALTTADARARLGLPARGRVLLFFGKGEPYKGLDLLVRAHADPSVPASTLLISCWFTDAGYRRTVMAAIEASPARDRIRLHEGFASNSEVEIFFKAADVLVLPYRNIYQSGVVFLGWRFGLPIVATDVGSLREFIDAETGVIAASADPIAIADAIRLFFERGARFRRETIAARAQRYRWDAICRALVPLYRQSERRGET